MNPYESPRASEMRSDKPNVCHWQDELFGLLEMLLIGFIGFLVLPTYFFVKFFDDRWETLTDGKRRAFRWFLYVSTPIWWGFLALAFGRQWL